jgi:retron-type reverse transcriptase
MSSPLGPLLANAFMSNFENKHMERLKELGIRRWWRFVDDIFATVESKEQAERVLVFIDVLHPKHSLYDRTRV